MRILHLLPIFLLFMISASAQKLVSGNLNSLKGQKSYDVMFTYDSMMIGDVIREEKYLKEKKIEWEAKEPGKGTAFINQWFDDRQKLYEPTFIQFFEKYSDVKLHDKNAKYTLILKTKRTEGGWNIGITSHPGEIGGELWVIETAKPDHVLAKIAFPGFRGKVSSGNDFEMTWRIKFAYETAGRWLGTFMKKKTK